MSEIPDTNIMRCYASDNYKEESGGVTITKNYLLEIADTIDALQSALTTAQEENKRLVLSLENKSISKCGASLCDKHSYSYVDGNNISITKNSKPHCERCYMKVYGGDK